MAMADWDDGKVHPVERRRVAEAARIFSYEHDLSPQTFAQRIISHPRVQLRRMREGVNPISRRAVANLMAGKHVRAPTVQAVRSFICQERNLPDHIFRIDPRMVTAAKAETALRVGVLPHASYTRFVRKYGLFQKQTRFTFYFQIEYEPADRVLFVRGKATVATTSDKWQDKKVFVSGYAMPVGPVLALTLADYTTSSRHLIDLSIADLLRQPVIQHDLEGRSILHHEAHAVRMMLPAAQDPSSSWIIEGRELAPMVTRSRKRLREGDFSIEWWADDGDQFGIGGLRYLYRGGEQGPG